MGYFYVDVEKKPPSGAPFRGAWSGALMIVLF